MNSIATNVALVQLSHDQFFSYTLNIGAPIDGTNTLAQGKKSLEDPHKLTLQKKPTILSLQQRITMKTSKLTHVSADIWKYITNINYSLGQRF